MPFTRAQQVIIDFESAIPFVGRPAPDGPGLAAPAVRLVESQSDQGHSFALHDGERPEYTLTCEETEQLVALLGQIAVTVPWQSMAGFDGTDYALVLRGAMSSISFGWWVTVPTGWESVGAVFDYVMNVARRQREAAP